MAAKNLLAREISRITRYYDEVIQVDRLPHDDGSLLKFISASKKSTVRMSDLRHFGEEKRCRPVFLIDGTLNHHSDIQTLLDSLRAKISRHGRVVAVLYNPYLRIVYRLATWFGLRKGPMPTTFLTRTDLGNLSALSGFEVVRQRPCVFIPFSMFGLGFWLNGWISAIPWVRYLSLTFVVVLRPIERETSAPSLAVVIPARNERGNIENAIIRIPKFEWNGCQAQVEVVFVEGHSADGTWEEILRIQKKYSTVLSIQALQQEGKGKADAVRMGFSKAKSDLLMICDADLTVPPEDLVKFYRAYCAGLGDFVNGSRLVYPQENQAMRPLNWLGNVFFAKALSWVLDNNLGDSLCGTKVVAREDYKLIQRWRKDFGDFDPFGDFELLFPASVLGLGVIEVPVCYRARTYGETNISRFTHGWMLLKMTLIGLFRIKTGL